MFIGYWPYAIFYSRAPYRNFRIKLEPWIIAAGLSVQIGNRKNYVGRETTLYCATRANCTACPPKISESEWAALPPLLHSISEGNRAASGQCGELGYDRAGHRCSVFLPRASLFGNSLVWTFLFFFPEYLEIPRDSNMFREMVFSGSVCCVCCSMFVWTFTGTADWNGKCFCVYALFSHIKYPEVQ